MTDAFGNALGFALSQNSTAAGQQQVSELRDASKPDAAWGVNEQNGKVILSGNGVDAEADHYSRLNELDYLRQRAAATNGLTAADIADAEFGGNYGGSPYAMDETRTLQHMKGHAETWGIVKQQMAEANAMADAQSVSAQNQRELNRTASLVEMNSQAQAGSVAANTGNALFVSDGGAAFGNRQLSILSRSQVSDPDWSENVMRGYQGEQLSVMAPHNAVEAAKLGSLLKFGFDLTPVGAVYNYFENTVAGRPFSAILSIAPYAIPGAVLARSTDGIVTNTAGKLGREGEALASQITGAAKNTESWIVNGRTRIPDQILAQDIATRNPLNVVEVKNVQYQAFTRQLRDYADLVGPGGRVDVLLPPSARVSGPLQRAFDNPFSPLNRMDLVAPR